MRIFGIRKSRSPTVVVRIGARCPSPARCVQRSTPTWRALVAQGLPPAEEKIVIASVQIGTVTGEHLLSVQANDLDPYITLTVRQHSVYLTRDQARQAADALRTCALSAVDDEFGNTPGGPGHW